jgi:hypothetical protein
LIELTFQFHQILMLRFVLLWAAVHPLECLWVDLKAHLPVVRVVLPVVPQEVPVEPVVVL